MKPSLGYSKGGFTLIELLAVMVILAVLAQTVLPALSKNRNNSKAAVCLSNGRQMMAAWQSYAANHDGLLVKSHDAAVVPENNRRELFTRGFLDWSSDPANWDPALTVAKSPLQPFLGNSYEAWRCPADEGLVSAGGNRRLPRVRSISMSQVFDYGAWLPAAKYRTYSRIGQIVNPAQTWVTMDEHPDSMNDAALVVQMVEDNAAEGRVVDGPAWQHEGAAGISFADGHAEMKKWTGAAMRVNVTYSGGYAGAAIRADDQASLNDLKWWSRNTTVLRTE